MHADLARDALHGRLGDLVDSVHGMAVLFALDRRAAADDLRAALFGEAPVTEAVVATIGDAAVGFALHYPSYSTVVGRPGLHLEDLYVRAEHRGAGVGLLLLRHLARHGVHATADEVDAAGRPTGEVLHDDAARHGADLLVMGAYGHPRLREVVFGGATRGLLGRLPLPLFLSR